MFCFPALFFIHYVLQQKLTHITPLCVSRNKYNSTMSDLIGDFLLDLEKEGAKSPVKVYSKATLTNSTKLKLLPYQVDHVVKLIQVLIKSRVALDGSDTGTGKTYVAAATAKELGRRVFVICPKTVIPSWLTVLKYFGVGIVDIVNYETVRCGKTYTTREFITRTKSPYVDKLEPAEIMFGGTEYHFRWHLPSDALVIVDEAHRCKNTATDNGQFLLSMKQVIDKKIPVLLLSATICERVKFMKIPFVLFGIIPSTDNFSHYKKTLNSRYHSSIRRRSRLDKENAEALMIYQEIQDHTARLRIKMLGDMFPKNQWCAQQFIAEDTDKISEAYDKLASYLRKLRDKPASHVLARIQQLKMEIEFRKAPIFVEQTELYRENGKSVIIFVNYLKTLKFLVKKLDIKCTIQGRQTLEERVESMRKFQDNEEKIIICQIRAGGIGINLHDVHGDHPRVSLINYPDAASDLIQALGRACRAGAKTPVLQRIIFVANVPYEQKIMRNINRKLNNISAINDGDLETHKYKVMIKKKTVEAN